MKWITWVMCVAFAVPAFALEISEEGRREAQLFESFLQAIYVYQDDAPRAFAALQQALTYEPQSHYLRRLLVERAVSMNKPDLADEYISYIQDGEQEAEDWVVYATYQMQKGNTPEAVSAYEKAFALAPEDSEIAYRYLLLLSTYDEPRMIETMEKMAQDRSEVAAQAYTQIGKIYSRRNQFEKALLYLDKAVLADPQDPAPRLAKGEIYEKTSKYFLMLHEFEELEKMGYGNAGIFSRMAAVFIVVQDTAKAEEYFLKAKAHDNGDPASNYFLSLLAEQKGDFAKAIVYLQDGSDYAGSAAHQIQVAFLQQKLNQPKESLRTLAAAYKRFEGNVEVAYYYGLLLSDEEQFKRAARVFGKLVEQRPEYTDARLHYAYALESLKKYKEMEQQLKVILSQQPQNAAALNLWAYSLAQRETRLDEALEYITRALAVAPRDVSFQDTLGWVYVKRGQLDAAENVLLALPQEVQEEYPEIRYHIGVLRYEQGRLDEALIYLDQARAGWPAAEKLYKKLSR